MSPHPFYRPNSVDYIPDSEGEGVMDQFKVCFVGFWTCFPSFPKPHHSGTCAVYCAKVNVDAMVSGCQVPSLSQIHKMKVAMAASCCASKEKDGEQVQRGHVCNLESRF